ncbi:MAG: lytic transglycosylase domain-containing protein, partial [Chloroflexota bacterium]
LTLVTPLMVVVADQLAPRRPQRDTENLVTIAMAAANTSAANVSASSRVAPRSAVGGRAILTQEQEARLSAEARLPSGAFSLPDGNRLGVWYRVVAQEQGVNPYLLEALHQIESSAAPEGCWPNADGSGAIGPFQFKPATFEQFGVDGNGDGVIDICGFADSLVSAAVYLRALGAGNGLDGPAVRQALERYGTDVDRVIDLARYYRSRDASLTAEASPSS